MKRIFLTIGLLTALAAPAAATAGSPIEGRWRKGNLQIEIKPCGNVLCGTIVRASPKQKAKAQRGSGTELIGARLIENIRPIGNDSYKARVFLADRNMHATGTIRQVSNDRLSVRGCAMLILCKSTTWERVR
jgi:uncharacterized protein (DUF2147 family)